MARVYTRRQALRYGMGSAALAGLPPALGRPAQAGRAGGTLPQPKVLKSRDGELVVPLRCVPATVDMRAKQPVKTYTYDGVVPGHTWELQPGDTLRVKLRNDLPKLDEPPVLNRPHEWTTTNLHTHGLHVSPSGNSDNIFLSIPPGEGQSYEIKLPGNHPGGIFWYHPHRHGAVTQQVRAGMAGMIVVRGAIDQVDEVAAAQEQIMVLQAIELGDDFQLLDPIPNPTKEQAFFPRTQILYTVNGVLRPKVTMYPGQVQRWRIVNAAEGKYMSLKLCGHDFRVLAWDGLTMAAAEGAEHLMLSAGNRVEVLVKARKPGQYQLILTPGSSQHPDIPGMPDEQRGAARRHCPDPSGPEVVPGSELDPRPILTVEVRDKGPEMGLPDKLPLYDPPILPNPRKRAVRYTVDRDPDKEFKSFGVNDVAFDPKRDPYRMRLGTAEEWTLVNDLDPKLDRHAHVFHIHVNPFKVTAINGRTLDTPLWRDTFVLTGRDGDSFTFVTNLDNFTGKFVHHCHVLSHEDLGMMESVEIVKKT